MRETEGENPAPSAPDDEIEEEDVFFRDVSEDLDDEERGSYAILLILAVGGFAVGLLLVGITLSSAIALQDYIGELGWVFAPLPMLVFGLGSIWQFEAVWLQRFGAAALGFALAQYIMLAISFATLDI